MAGQMRLRKQRQATYAAGVVKLVPRNFAEHLEPEVADNEIENGAQTVNIYKRPGVAAAGVNDPFGSQRQDRWIIQILCEICGLCLTGRQ